MKKIHTIHTHMHTQPHTHPHLQLGLQAAHNSHTNALGERHLSGNRKSTLGRAFCLCDFIAPPKQSNVQQQKQLAACQKYQSITTGGGVARRTLQGQGGGARATLYFISNVFFSSRCFYLFSMRFRASLGECCRCRRRARLEGDVEYAEGPSCFGTTFDVLCKQSRR